MKSSTDLIITNHLSVKFGAVTALDDLSLVIHDDNQIRGIIGPNGAGKSTFLSVIAGELNPTAGTVVLFGEIMHRFSPEYVCRKGIARTFQIPRPFYGLTVEDNVMVSGLANGNITTSRNRARDVLEMLNMAKFAKQYPQQLNLAGRKRLELARALMTRPKVLLSDELFEGLNESDVDWLVRVIKEEIASRMKIVMVEHVMSALRKLADKLYVLNHGQLIAEGDTDEVLSSGEVISAYLGGLNRVHT